MQLGKSDCRAGVGGVYVRGLGVRKLMVGPGFIVSESCSTESKVVCEE